MTSTSKPQTRTVDAVLARLKTLHPMLIDLSLDRIAGLLVSLGNPNLSLPPVVHIAGTNGKGSTAAFLRAMFEAAGKRVHLYSSPHLVRFNERIQVAGADGKCRPIPDVALLSLLERVERANAGAAMTFFEITTAAALLAFAEIPADVVILEVGLGGRADATNVIAQPILTVITPVSLDHADKLGKTVARIAVEKAGILKFQVPAIISQQDDDGLEAIRTIATHVRAPLTIWGEDFEAFEQRGRMLFQNAAILLDLPRPALLGRHQIVNAGTAIAAAMHLGSLGLDQRAIERGLIDVTWPARMQQLRDGILSRPLANDAELWLDGGHNPAGGRALSQTLADLEERAPKQLFMIVGMMGQKDASGFLSPFRGLAKRLVTVPVPGAHEAPHSAQALCHIAQGLGFEATAAPDVPEAIAAVTAIGTAPKRILICGSLYLAGHVLALETGTTQQSN